MNFAEKLKEKGFNIVQTKKFDTESLIEIYHLFMSFYHTWIPFEEFLKLPINVTIKLLNLIKRDKLLEQTDIHYSVILGYAKKETITELKNKKLELLKEVKI